MNKNLMGKIAAYGTGAMVGGGLTWLGWRWLEKRGIDPLGFIRKKAVEGDRIYYDPANDPELDIDSLTPEEIDEDDRETEEEDEEEDEPEGPAEASARTYEEPYMIDEATFSHSEEDGYKHDFLTYYAADGQVTDVNGEILSVEPWKVLGVGCYELIGSRECHGDSYVRNEQRKIDYVISKEEGSLND